MCTTNTKTITFLYAEHWLYTNWTMYCIWIYAPKTNMKITIAMTLACCIIMFSKMFNCYITNYSSLVFPYKKKTMQHTWSLPESTLTPVNRDPRTNMKCHSNGKVWRTLLSCRVNVRDTASDSMVDLKNANISDAHYENGKSDSLCVNEYTHKILCMHSF